MAGEFGPPLEMNIIQLRLDLLRIGADSSLTKGVWRTKQAC